MKVHVPVRRIGAYKTAYCQNSYLMERNSEIVAIDLGLSVKWANCNAGANSLEEYGNYYAWGETETKDNYNAGNSIWWNVKYADLSLD